MAHLLICIIAFGAFLPLSVCGLDNFSQNVNESCKIDFIFGEGESIFNTSVPCYEINDEFMKQFHEFTNITLIGNQRDKTVNPFEKVTNPNVEILKLENCYIENFNESSVPKMRNLKSLEFNNNEIENISINIFTVFINLEELSFVENDAPSLNFSILLTLPNLKKLTIKQRTWKIQLQELRGSSVISLQLSVDEVTTGIISPATDYNTDSLRELIITNSSLNLELRQSARIGLLRNVKIMILQHNRMTTFPFFNFDLSNLETLDLSGNSLQSINLNEFTNYSSKLETINISNNEITQLKIDMADERLKSLIILDISKNKLKYIQILNYANRTMSADFQIIADSNPWNCTFLLSQEYIEVIKLFKYERDTSYLNVNGLNCFETQIESNNHSKNKSAIEIILIILIFVPMFVSIYMCFKRRNISSNNNQENHYKVIFSSK